MSTNPGRRCLYCQAPLKGGPQQRFCSPAHRMAFNRRAEHQAGNGDLQRQREVVQQALVDGLTPVVREAVDDDVLKSIRGMVKLIPEALQTLQADLQSASPQVRSNAAALVLKYTVGNPNVAPPREGTGQGITIINALPDAARPAVDAEVVEPDALPAPADEDTRRCDTCRLDKPLSEFPANGPRCASCLAQRKAAVEEAFGVPSDHALSEPSPAADVQRQGGDGQPEVGQAGPGLQPGDVRTTGLVETRYADPAPPQGGSGPQGPAPLRSAAHAFPGPPDPKRFSRGQP